MSQRKIVAFLASRAGRVEDPTGRGLTAELARAIGYDKPAALNVLLGRMESEGLIVRDVRGLRTYRIALTEDQPVSAPAGPSRVPPRRRAVRDSITEPVSRYQESGANPAESWRSMADPPAPVANRVAQSNGIRGHRSGPGRAVDAEAWRDVEPVEPVPAGDAGTGGMRRPVRRPAAIENEHAPPYVPPPPVDHDDDRTDRWSPPRAKPARRHWWAIEIPHLSGAPSNVVLAIVGVTMSALVITTVVSVFASRGSAPAPTTANVANTSIDACKLVTNPEVTNAFGRDAQDPHSVLGACVYDNGRQQLIVDVADNNARTRFDDLRGDSAQDVPGIGDGGFYQNGRLAVLKGSRMVLVTLVPYTPSAVNPAVITLARAAVARL